MMHATSTILVMASIGPIVHSLVIGNRQPFILGRTVSRRYQSSPMRMYIDHDFMPITSILDMASVSATSTATYTTNTPLSNIFDTASSLTLSDPQELEAELLNDVSFVALDMPEFLSHNTIWLRLSNLIGRMLILSSDYTQSDQIPPGEWVIHASMLAVSTHMFLCTAGPLISAIFSIPSLSVRDRRAYCLLFEAVGLSVLQFKTLLSSKTLDWVEYAPNEVVELNGEDMYFLYSGEAAIPAANTAGNNAINNKNKSNVDASKSIDNSDHTISDGEALYVSNMVFGDVQFAKMLETSLHNSRSTKKKSKLAQKTTCAHPKSSVGSSFTVGPNGASMMRISTSKLLQLMKNDDELCSSIQRLILQCMQEKLSKTLQEGGLKINTSKKTSTTTSSTVFHPTLDNHSSSSSTSNVTHTIPSEYFR
eukprot:CAMPEP_0196132538 /NCGR_PEP_ID=MMETSP0910-20130528/2117_1 /TAXON_ID=49265 /ORGANISM="Thalassiosira rotula, Strain GSO102" /LENGTH=421 /DNA_ID=CAMNT_0041392157 /DNA_START=509 /DNA_END=1774 /DNA_ORIENTATION=-